MCNDGNGFISSDSGSLMLLDDQKTKYYIKIMTKSFSSPQHCQAIRNNTGENIEELLAEDKYQLNLTFVILAKLLKRANVEPSSLAK
jgi:hypothetical protein